MPNNPTPPPPQHSDLYLYSYTERINLLLAGPPSTFIIAVRIVGATKLGECPTLFQPGEKIPVKFSGDGAKFSRTSNMMILSFSILVPQGRYLSGTGNHTIAVVKGCEDYETISKAFGI
eukprot:Em0008g217a